MEKNERSCKKESRHKMNDQKESSYVPTTHIK